VDAAVGDGAARDASGACVANVDCDNGTFCDGRERCEPTAAAANARGCVAATDPCAAAETCVELTESCRACTAPDADGDGVSECAGDCDDANASRHPGATELCNAVDEDCNPATFGVDADSDGFESSACCSAPGVCGADCDDSLNTVNPGAAESCNAGLDDDCDGLADSADGVCVPCGPGYVGFDGDCRDVDECGVPGFCSTGALSCTNVPGTFVCTCQPGYVTATPIGALCQDIDECATNPCGVGTCSNGAGSYGCACPAGYRQSTTMPLTCVDIDECAEGTAGCDTSPVARCADTDGGFTCACPAGYDGAGLGESGCADVDECAAGTTDCDRDPNACVNAFGSFACSCPPGFIGTARGVDGCQLDDPSLQLLAVGAGATLAPTFAAATVHYTVMLAPGATSAPITATVAHPTRATIRIDGATVASSVASVVTVTSYAPRTVSVSVTTETGASRTYTLTLVRSSVYAKATNTGNGDSFGRSVALSADGSTLAVGASGEDSSATGIDGNEASNAETDSGAVYVYRRVAGTWLRDAYVKASNTDPLDSFGCAVSLSDNGEVLLVGAREEDSGASGVGGNGLDNTVTSSGAAYVFRRSASGWAEEAYLKPGTPAATARFGASVAIAGDGATVIVGEPYESSSTTGVGAVDVGSGASFSGAVHIYAYSGGVWALTHFVKASNPDAFDYFGLVLAIDAAGDTFVVGARGESSSAIGIGGYQLSNGSTNAGAAYVFQRTGPSWVQEAYVKASNTGGGDLFGVAVAISGDGRTIAVGAEGEDSGATGVGGSQISNALADPGAAYVFRRGAVSWSQDAYVKATNTNEYDAFGSAMSLSNDGSVLAVGAYRESSIAVGINGVQANNDAVRAGATYVYRRVTGAWVPEAYVKASNTGTLDFFGTAIALSGSGDTLAITASSEDSNARGIGGDQTNEAGADSGAVYVY